MQPKRRKLTPWQQTKLWCKRQMRRLSLVALGVVADRVFFMWWYWGEDTGLAMKIIYAETIGALVYWFFILGETLLMIGMAVYIPMLLLIAYYWHRKEQFETQEFLIKAQDLLNPYANRLIDKINKLSETQRLFVEQAIKRFHELRAKRLIPATQDFGQSDISHQDKSADNNQEKKSEDPKPQDLEPEESKTEKSVSQGQEESAKSEEMKDPETSKDGEEKHNQVEEFNAAVEALDQEPPPVSSKQAKGPGRDTAASPPATTSANIIINPRNEESGIVEIRRDAGDSAGSLPAGPDQTSNAPPKVERPRFIRNNEREIPLEVRNEVRALAGLPPLTEPPERKVMDSPVVDQVAQSLGGSHEAVGSCSTKSIEDKKTESGLVEQRQPGDRDESVAQDLQESHGGDESNGLERGSGDNNPLVGAIIRFMEGRDVWKGSPTELWDELASFGEDNSQKDWPKNPVWIIRMLNDLDQKLQQANLNWSTGRTKKEGKWCKIERFC